MNRILKLNKDYEDTRGMSEAVKNRKQNPFENISDLRKSLHREEERRGISEEKVKNAFSLGIEMPKFGCYKTKLDFYTFRTKIDRLIPIFYTFLLIVHC